MCVFSSRSFWTSSSLDVPAGVTQEEGHTGILSHLLSAVHALIFLAKRIQPFLSLVDHEVEFCVLTISSFSTRWAFFFFFFFLVRKIPFAGIELTSQRVRGLRGTSELPGRPVQYVMMDGTIRTINRIYRQFEKYRARKLNSLVLSRASTSRKSFEMVNCRSCNTDHCETHAFCRAMTELLVRISCTLNDISVEQKTNIPTCTKMPKREPVARYYYPVPNF